MNVVCQASGAGARVVVASQQPSITAVAMNALSVVWATAGNGSSKATVKAALTTGSSPLVLTSDVTRVVALAADESSVYLLDQSATAGRIERLPVTGGEPTPIAGDVSLTPTSFTSTVEIALDVTAVFWTDTKRGLVLTAPK